MQSRGLDSPKSKGKLYRDTREVAMEQIKADAISGIDSNLERLIFRLHRIIIVSISREPGNGAHFVHV